MALGGVDEGIDDLDGVGVAAVPVVAGAGDSPPCAYTGGLNAPAATSGRWRVYR